jgi:UMF1 family MFS transporter
MTLDSQIKFWILAVCVGLFQGGVQALSRSYFAKIIPKEQSGEYFGIFDICGKGASFLGTTLVSITSQVTNSIHYGIGSLVILFILGFFLFQKSCKAE